jgi:hypothetical protein
VEGAVLAFRRGNEWMSLQSRCGRPVASAELMARHLAIGLAGRRIVSTAPVEVGGLGGFAQRLEVQRDGIGVQLETVTLVLGDCSIDWVLATRSDAVPSQAEFDAWWGSFRVDPERWPEGAR